jgi:ribonuclease HI
MGKTKFYVVWKGVKPGIYSNWIECKKQIDNFKNAKYKSYPSLDQAKAAYNNTEVKSDFIKLSISVDAASSGNPGIMEYQGVNTSTKQLLFKNGPFPNGTNNIGEFLAIVHGLAFLKKNNSNLPIYTDSITALSWVRKKKCNTKLEESNKNKELFEVIKRAENWLHTNNFNNKLIKWETKKWGEIPADFGRK